MMLGTVTLPAAAGFLPLPEIPQFIRGSNNAGQLVFDSESRFCLSSMQQSLVNIPELDTSVQTAFWRSDVPSTTHVAPPRVLLLHGADASSLEWRKLVPRLNSLGLSTVSVDWWSGGWTDRTAFCEHSELGRTWVSWSGTIPSPLMHRIACPAAVPAGASHAVCLP